MSHSFQRTKTDEQIYREAFIRSDASDAQRWFSILPRWHRFAARQGIAEAQNNLGLILANGK